MDHWILPLITFVPLVGAAIVMFIPRERAGAIRTVSIVLSFIPLVASIWLWVAYKGGAGAQFPHMGSLNNIQFGIDKPWIPSLGRGVHDGCGQPQHPAGIS